MSAVRHLYKYSAERRHAAPHLSAYDRIMLPVKRLPKDCSQPKGCFDCCVTVLAPSAFANRRSASMAHPVHRPRSTGYSMPAPPPPPPPPAHPAHFARSPSASAFNVPPPPPPPPPAPTSQPHRKLNASTGLPQPQVKAHSRAVPAEPYSGMHSTFPGRPPPPPINPGPRPTETMARTKSRLSSSGEVHASRQRKPRLPERPSLGQRQAPRHPAFESHQNHKNHAGQPSFRKADAGLLSQDYRSGIHSARASRRTPASIRSRRRPPQGQNPELGEAPASNRRARRRRTGHHERYVEPSLVGSKGIRQSIYQALLQFLTSHRVTERFAERAQSLLGSAIDMPQRGSRRLQDQY